MSELVRRDDGMLDRALTEIVRRAIDGVGPFKGAADLVEPLRRKGMSTHQIVTRLVRTQTTQATVQGAAAGVGGLMTAAIGFLPATAAAMFVQARLAAANGHDLDDPWVRDRIVRLVAGGSASTGAKKAGVEMGERAAKQLVPRLQARAAARSAARLSAGKSAGALSSRVAAGSAGRAVPVVGAVVGGTVDLVVTRRVAEKARREFIPRV